MLLVAIADRATASVLAQQTFAPTTSWRPPNVFPGSRGIDGMFDFILALTGAVLAGVLICLVVFLIRYRHRPGRRAVYTHGNPRLEIAWTVIPAVIMALIAAFSQRTWSQLKDPAQLPSGPDVVKVEVWARQFQWFFRYPGADDTFGRTHLLWRRNTGIPAEEIGLMRDDPLDVFEPEQIEAIRADPQRRHLLEPDPAAADDIVTSIMVIPVNRDVVFNLTSLDVLHSFYVPHMRIKQDAVPGLTSRVWIRSDRTSIEAIGQSAPMTAKPFDIVCAELCGANHYKMRGQLFVVTGDQFKGWLRNNAPE